MGGRVCKSYCKNFRHGWGTKEGELISAKGGQMSGKAVIFKLTFK